MKKICLLIALIASPVFAHENEAITLECRIEIGMTPDSITGVNFRLRVTPDLDETKTSGIVLSEIPELPPSLARGQARFRPQTISIATEIVTWEQRTLDIYRYRGDSLDNLITKMTISRRDLTYTQYRPIVDRDLEEKGQCRIVESNNLI